MSNTGTIQSNNAVEEGDEVLVQVNQDNGPRRYKRRKGNTARGNPKRKRPNLKIEIPNEKKDVEPKEESSSVLHDCPICRETLENANTSATLCGHVFCTSCIVKSIRTFKTCPTCRTKLTLKKIHPLYL